MKAGKAARVPPKLGRSRTTIWLGKADDMRAKARRSKDARVQDALTDMAKYYESLARLAKSRR
jgi:hypothetical protein